MPITRTPIVDDDGSGTTGTVLDNAWKQQLYDQIDVAGTWKSLPYNPADYTTDTGTTNWVVDPGDVFIRYTVIGKTLVFAFSLGNTSLLTAAVELRVQLPVLVGGAFALYNTIRCFDSGGQVTGLASAIAGSGYIAFRKFSGVAWVVGTNNVNVHGEITLEIQ